MIRNFNFTNIASVAMMSVRQQRGETMTAQMLKLMAFLRRQFSAAPSLHEQELRSMNARDLNDLGIGASEIPFVLLTDQHASDSGVSQFRISTRESITRNECPGF